MTKTGLRYRFEATLNNPQTARLLLIKTFHNGPPVATSLPYEYMRVQRRLLFRGRSRVLLLLWSLLVGGLHLLGHALLLFRFQD